jgi:hypothetical protein
MIQIFTRPDVERHIDGFNQFITVDCTFFCHRIRAGSQRAISGIKKISTTLAIKISTKGSTLLMISDKGSSRMPLTVKMLNPTGGVRSTIYISSLVNLKLWGFTDDGKGSITI